MPLYPDWRDLGLRLALTIAAGAVIGFNRGAGGHAAGLRTTILVCLAASVAMMQANILLPVGGKTPGSFSVMDIMRMPLGILTGVGFIGGGAILKRGDLVTGVTTAATLWVVTVIGLCLGGGQIALGIAATVLVVLTLWVLKWLDVRIPRECHAELVIEAGQEEFSPAALAALIAPLGYEARFRRQVGPSEAALAQLWFDIHWRRAEVAGPPLDLPARVNERYRVLSFQLTTESSG